MEPLYVLENINETAVRFAAFVGVLLLMACLELWVPRRRLVADKTRRWTTNLTIIALNSLLIRGLAGLVVPVAAVAAALWAQQNQFGLFNMLQWPPVLEIVLSIILLDLAIWAQHVASHRYSILWRLHQMHHADRDIDVTTGIRFHPIEIALSMLWKIACVLLLGAAPVAVFLFEVILNATALFSHANVALPASIDKWLRLVLVTPDMHRVHHSIVRRERDSNFGFNLSIWDRLFQTYTAEPEKGHDHMTIGLGPYQHAGPTRLAWSLSLPFARPGDQA